MTLLGLKAQECSSLWLTCPKAYVGQEIAYSRTYTDSLDLSKGSVVVATSGYFRLYVNGNLVSVPSCPMARAPYRESEDKTEPIACKFDVARYLRNDSNTITLLTCPSSIDETPVFSLRFNAVSLKGRTYVREADESWLCCPLNDFLTDYNSEYCDERRLSLPSNGISDEGIMHWLPVETLDYSFLADTKMSVFPSYEYINKVLKPRYFSVDWDEKGISYDFGNGFAGLIRVTLRDTKAGQHIYVAGSDYVCKGQSDEQFVLHFAASGFRKVYISGDKLFRVKNVSRVEGLQIVPKYTNNFSF